MQLELRLDNNGHLLCHVAHETQHAEIGADNGQAAATLFLAASRDLESDGCGECYWDLATGNYRWMFRREGARVRVVVLRAGGIVTGWENVFWTECDYPEWKREVERETGALAAGIC